MQQQLGAPWAHRPAHDRVRHHLLADRGEPPQHRALADRHTFVMPVVRELPRADGDGAHRTEW